MITGKIKRSATSHNKWKKQPFTLWNGEIIEVSEAQRIFAYHYAQGKTAKACHKIVSPDCTDRTAGEEGRKMSHNESVKLLIQHFKIERGKKYKKQDAEFINDLMEEARAKPSDMYDENGKLKHIKDMSEYLQSNLKIKIKAPKVTKTDNGMFSQPTLFGDAEDIEIEWDGKGKKEARTQLLQISGVLDEEENEKGKDNGRFEDKLDIDENNKECN